MAESGSGPAQKIGLIDEIGGIDDAIIYAANVAELEDYKVEYYSEKLSPEEMIIKKLLEKSDSLPGKSESFISAEWSWKAIRNANKSSNTKTLINL